MKRFVQHIFLVILIAAGLAPLSAHAQVATSVNPSGFGDRQFSMDTINSAKRIRDDDKLSLIHI